MKKPNECQPKTVEKRRQSDFALAPISYFTGKKPMPVHSSVSAISNKSPNIVQLMSSGELEIAEKNSSTPVRAVDKNEQCSE